MSNFATGEFNFLFEKKDGKLIYKASDSTFDDIYRHKKDPWDQTNMETNKYYQYARSRVMKMMRNNLYFKSNILEVGCGNGFSTNYLKKSLNCGNFYGCDISGVAIEQALKNYNNIYFFQHNIKKEITLSCSFDYIIFSDILWYILPDLKQCIQNAFLSLNNHGRIIIYNAFLNNQEYGRETINGFSGLLNFVDENFPNTCIYSEKSDEIDYRYFGATILKKSQ